MEKTNELNKLLSYIHMGNSIFRIYYEHAEEFHDETLKKQIVLIQEIFKKHEEKVTHLIKENKEEATKSITYAGIMGIYKENSGKISVDGQNVYDNVNIKDRMMYICDDLFYYPTFSIMDAAKMYAGLYNNWSWDEFNRLSDVFKIDN